MDNRDLDDLRLAFTILTTYWHQQDTRTLGAVDVVRFHSAFGTSRLSGVDGGRGRLDRRSLLSGGDRLIGSWFSEAAQDWDRLGWGIAFETVAGKQAHDPTARLGRASIGPLSPPRRPTSEQIWHTYPPVEVPDTAATVEAVLAVEHWPDYAAELGRFTPLRRGGLQDQTFEIEVVGFPTPRTPVFIRAYVTITTLVTADDKTALDTWVDDVKTGFAAHPHEMSPIPEGAVVNAGFDLTCHEGHFMGDAKNRLVLYSLDGHSYLRAAGTWDPMPWHLAELYDRVGQLSQHAFWGMAGPDQSMLHQIALQVGRRMNAAAHGMSG
ncbi:MAG: hypothetical protein ACR2HR_07265 [Euzebya sp.]